ncbi:tripartite tricarboxylate transporter TctB family protein [Sphaerochaeta sp. S2]|jgi:putative tricarboxylic transport membrane protein|uniref:tripartite tricarboxylate transporter TctB family protein n=1 Tax=Sphaerochaeta sp. S2 TaxID=2798868 RepID=UPI0018E9F1D1|nr:tripartite tricarboxylate transporter TctB family protein [Sphaerochaeta sp. S2]MBJ2356509.1 tripartite tricarboxylate transporter TctB family protein [Sphaerochaeta sp. S2]MCK9347612.1 tripartite tricarboxylate transporter TctB family protein [Sphaerochaeta sp.]
MRKANFIVSGVFTAFAILIIAVSLTYPPSNHGVPGPGMFPIIIASLIILSSLSLFITTLRMGKEADTSVDLKSKNVMNVYVTMVGLVLYFILLPLVGFVTTSIVMLILYIKWFSKRPWWKTVLISVIFVLAIFFLFGSVLNVPMRFGMLI